MNAKDKDAYEVKTDLTITLTEMRSELPKTIDGLTGRLWGYFKIQCGTKASFSRFLVDHGAHNITKLFEDTAVELDMYYRDGEGNLVARPEKKEKVHGLPKRTG